MEENVLSYQMAREDPLIMRHLSWDLKGIMEWAPHLRVLQEEGTASHSGQWTAGESGLSLCKNSKEAIVDGEERKEGWWSL